MVKWVELELSDNTVVKSRKVTLSYFSEFLQINVREMRGEIINDQNEQKKT